MTIRLLAVALLVFAPAAFASTPNWPHWRGPNRDGTSAAVNVPTQWSETENIAWKIELPAWASSTPIVWGDRVFITCPEDSGGVAPEDSPELAANASGPSGVGQDLGGDKVELLCLDRADGKLIWKRTIGTGNKNILNRHNMSSPCPVTDGETIWVMSGKADIVAFDFEGNERWRRNLETDYNRVGMLWAYAASPVLHDGRLIIPMVRGSKTIEPGYVLALDAATGKTIWKTERRSSAKGENKDAFSTPLIFEHEEKTQVVVNGGDLVTGYDFDSGSELWRYTGLKNKSFRLSSSPVFSGELIFVPSAGIPLLAIRPGGGGDITGSHLVWETRLGPETASPLTNGKYLWFLKANGVFACLDAKTGENVYEPARVAPMGTFVASPVLAEGRIYVMSDEGDVTILDAGPEFKIIRTNELDGEYALASPAIVDGQIFIRTSHHLYCIAEREKS